ncbi:MAG: ABC transporter ATP-binding protein [Gemmataceae bacterium]
MSSNLALQTQDLTVRYGTFTAVGRVSLNVQGGQIFGLLGPNGSGKSSTLAAIAGVLDIAQGNIFVDGVSRKGDPDGYSRRVGYVPQDLALYEEFTALENLRFFGGLYGLPRKTMTQKAEQVLALVGLSKHMRKRVGTLSGGMQRRVNLACALLHEPSLLLLDEPTVGLDIAARESLFALLRLLARQGHAIVITTHMIREAQHSCDRFGIMAKGKLLAQGTLRELRCGCRAFNHSVVSYRIDAAHIERPGPHRLAPSRVDLQGEQIVVTVSSEGERSKVLELLSRSGLQSPTEAPANLSLEQIFAELIQQDERQPCASNSNPSGSGLARTGNSSSPTVRPLPYALPSQ